jgi:hypothetical protein
LSRLRLRLGLCPTALFISEKRTVQKGCSPHTETPACQHALLGTKRTLRCVCSTEYCNGDDALVEAGLEEGRNSASADRSKRTNFALGQRFGLSPNYLIMLIFVCLFITGSFSLLIMNTVCVHLC